MRSRIPFLSSIILVLMFLATVPPVTAASVKDSWILVWSPITKSYRTLAKGEMVTVKNGLVNLGSAACGAEALLLGAGAKSGYETTTAIANKNFVDFRCASTATSGWSQAGAFYIKAQDYRLSASALRGYAYADAPSGASTGEISGVYGIAEQHGVGTISSTGILAGLRSRITIPTGLTISAGNYYGLLIETDMLSAIKGIATSSAAIKIADPNNRQNTFQNFLEITNGDVGTANTNMMQSDLGNANTVAGLRVKINGVVYWIQLAAEGS